MNMHRSDNVNRELSKADIERLAAYKSALARSRWFLLIGLLLGSLLVIHVYLEGYSFDRAQTRETLKKRYSDALARFVATRHENTPLISSVGNHTQEFKPRDVIAFIEFHTTGSTNLTSLEYGIPTSPEDSVFGMSNDHGIDDLLLEYKSSIDSTANRPGEVDEIGEFEEFIDVLYARIATNNSLAQLHLGNRDIPLLGLQVPANDYVPIISGMLIVFVVGTWLSVRSVSGIIKMVPRENSLLMELVMLNFTFTGIADGRRDRWLANAVQICSFSIPCVFLILAVLGDLSPLFVDENENLLTGASR